MIKEFYENCDIFVTGGSGVVGKALIEKLLRSCNVNKIFVLLRPKKNSNFEQRLEQMRNAKIFRLLRSTKPTELNKLVAIPGDATLPTLGITSEYSKILENVSIVFHCAATVRFDEPIKVALRLNVGGTFEALKFAQTLKNLKIFMHVSTFFSNPYLTYVEPKLYQSPMDWKVCLKMLNDNVNQDIFDFVTKKMIIGFPNTYTFTKNIAESMVNDFRHRLPLCIYRPSIVLFSLSEPSPGFPPTLIGAMGLFTLAGAGILKVLYLRKEARLDITPLDLGVKAMLYYAQQAEVTNRNEQMISSVPVYLFSSSKRSLQTFRETSETVYDLNLWEVNAFEKCFLIPSMNYTSNRFLYMCAVFTKQVLPAIIGDLLLQLFGRKPVLMSIGRRIFITLEVMQSFLFNNYESDGITDEANMMKALKGSEFDVSQDLEMATTEIGVYRNCCIMVSQIRAILLNEDPKTLPKARKIMKIKKNAYNILRLIFAYSILSWLYRILLRNFNALYF